MNYARSFVCNISLIEHCRCSDVCLFNRNIDFLQAVPCRKWTNDKYLKPAIAFVNI